MTVLIAQNTKDKIILGADTVTFYGNSGSKFHLTDHKNRLKIMSVNDIIYAGTGSVSQVINFGLFCQTRKPERSDQLGIQRFFIDFSKWLREQDIQFNSELNNYFLVFEKRLFHFERGAVQEILEDDFATDGVGFKEAYMAMYLGKSVKEAIDLTIKMNVWASGEAQIVEIQKK